MVDCGRLQPFILYILIGLAQNTALAIQVTTSKSRICTQYSSACQSLVVIFVVRTVAAKEKYVLNRWAFLKAWWKANGQKTLITARMRHEVVIADGWQELFVSLQSVLYLLQARAVPRAVTTASQTDWPQVIVT